MQNTKIYPSLLAADPTKLGEEVEKIDKAGADGIHIDVMDNKFVSNETVFNKPEIITNLRGYSEKIFDVHLMIENPEKRIEDFAKAGADIITVHQEATNHIDGLLREIKKLGKKAGVALNPGTPACFIEEIIDVVDLILVMTVNPGFGGQKFIDKTKKIEYIASLIKKNGRNIDLQVDGGINDKTAKICVDAGADLLVAGSYIFTGLPKNYKESIKSLRV